MNKRVIYLMVLCLFVMSSTAFATNWVYVASIAYQKIYIDTETVTKGDTLIFRELVQF